MGKKSKQKAAKKAKKKSISIDLPKECKTKCCDKYKKGEHKRCKRCPLFDLIHKPKAA